VSKVVLFENVSLDGVMQAPGRPDEDRRDGFDYGGWAMPYADAVQGEVAGASMANTGSLLLGRRTYEDVIGYWNTTDSPFKDALNDTPKYVASTTLKEPLRWPNSTLLEGDALEAVSRLRAQPGKDLVVLGSGELAQSLMRGGLVDEYLLLINPLVLGTGRRLFAHGASFTKLRLVDSRPTTTGVIIATYASDTGAS
jgi:dihydrofolate reductase